MKSTAYILFVILVLTGTRIQARESALIFERITTEQGLSDNHVLCITQCRDGFLWFGTRDGLNRFDGYRFLLYRYENGNPNSLSDGNILCMLEDSRGALWLGTGNGGLNRFDKVTGRFRRFYHKANNPGSISHNSIAALCEDAEGNIWALGIGYGSALNKLAPGDSVFRRFDSGHFGSKYAELRAPKALCSDAQGTVWVYIARVGMYRYDPKQGRFLNAVPESALGVGLRNDAKLYADNYGALWIHTVKGLHSYDPELNYLESWPGLGPRIGLKAAGGLETMYRDSLGTLWLGTRTGGLKKCRAESEFSETYVSTDNPNSIGGNCVYTILEDRTGNLWFGTDGGISKLTKSRWYFSHYGFSEHRDSSLSHPQVRCVYEDKNEILWVGTGGGLNRINIFTGAFSVLRAGRSEPGGRGLSDDAVNALLEDRDGRLWIGTDRGLDVLHKTEGRIVGTVLDSIFPGGLRVQSLVQDRRGIIWIGTLGNGLVALDSRRGVVGYYRNEPDNPRSLCDNHVWCLSLDSASLLWIGTNNGLSALQIENGEIFNYRLSAAVNGGPASDRVRYIYRERPGVLWLATAGGGLNRFEPEEGTLNLWLEQDGLGGNNVCGILPDSRGNLWISTAKGLSKFNPATAEFKNYTAADGIHVSDFYFGACFKNSYRELYFGGSGGLVLFEPTNVMDNPFAPQVRITSFKILDREWRGDTVISAKRRIELAYDENIFTLEFAALDFTNPEKNSYRYLLENYDESWREVSGERHFAAYTQVPPGEYTFRVIGRNNDGKAGQHEARLHIVIQPAYWQSFWFEASIWLLAALLLGGGTYYRLRLIRTRADLQRKVLEYRMQSLRAQMNPHFIFNSLNSIASLIIEADAKSALAYLSKFARLMRSILENSRNDTISLEEELKALRYYLDLEALRFEHKYDYSLTVENGLNLDDVKVPPLLIQPYVENAILHGLANREDKGELRIDIRRNGRALVCSVTDNGVGRAKAAEIKKRDGIRHKSLALEVNRERLELMAGRMSAQYDIRIRDLYDENKQAAGTRVDIFIPLE